MAQGKGRSLRSGFSTTRPAIKQVPYLRYIPIAGCNQQRALGVTGLRRSPVAGVPSSRFNCSPASLTIVGAEVRIGGVGPGVSNRTCPRSRGLLTWHDEHQVLAIVPRSRVAPTSSRTMVRRSLARCYPVSPPPGASVTAAAAIFNNFPGVPLPRSLLQVLLEQPNVSVITASSDWSVFLEE